MFHLLQVIKETHCTFQNTAIGDLVYFKSGSFFIVAKVALKTAKGATVLVRDGAGPYTHTNLYIEWCHLKHRAPSPWVAWLADFEDNPGHAPILIHPINPFATTSSTTTARCSTTNTFCRYEIPEDETTTTTTRCSTTNTFCNYEIPEDETWD